MPVKAHKATFRGHEYAFNTLPATKSLRAMSKLSGIIGKGMADLALVWAEARKKAPKGEDDGQEDIKAAGASALESIEPDQVAKVALSFLDALAHDDFPDLVLELVGGEVHLDGRPVRDIDDEFSGQAEVLLFLAFESAKVNFSGFLAGSLGGVVMDKMRGMTQA